MGRGGVAAVVRAAGLSPNLYRSRKPVRVCSLKSVHRHSGLGAGAPARWGPVIDSWSLMGASMGVGGRDGSRSCPRGCPPASCRQQARLALLHAVCDDGKPVPHRPSRFARRSCDESPTAAMPEQRHWLLPGSVMRRSQREKQSYPCVAPQCSTCSPGRTTGLAITSADGEIQSYSTEHRKQFG